MTRRKFERLLRAYGRWSVKPGDGRNSRGLPLGEWLQNKSAELRGMINAIEIERGHHPIALPRTFHSDVRVVNGGELPIR